MLYSLGNFVDLYGNRRPKYRIVTNDLGTRLDLSLYHTFGLGFNQDRNRMIGVAIRDNK